MTNPQKALIPGILIGCLLLVALSRLVSPPSPAVAATDQPSQNTAACAHTDRYPDQVVAWCSLIESAAEKYDLDPLLIASVMLVESGGQPEVISHSGAVGLLQVMPRDGIASTFQCINGPCFANRPSIAQLKEPEFNVNYGAKMLAGLAAREGNIRDALKAYGPMDVGYSYADKVLAIHTGL